MNIKNFKYDAFLTKYFRTSKSKYNIFFCLNNFYGIGHYNSQNIIKYHGFSIHAKLQANNSFYLHKIYRFIKFNLKFTLKQVKFINVFNIKSIKNYKSYKHIHFMPVRGQRTRTNANTRKKYKII